MESIFLKLPIFAGEMRLNLHCTGKGTEKIVILLAYQELLLNAVPRLQNYDISEGQCNFNRLLY